jgi:outer membrane immunogenic protein
MRNYITALAVGLGLLVTPHAATYAADLGKGPAAAVSVDPIDVLAYKGGLSAGVLGGYSAAIFETEGIDFGAQDPMLGGFIGYTYVKNGWGVGIESDYLWTAIKSAADEGGFSLSASNDYLASVRGRAGITWGPLFVFTTAGVAFTEQKVEINGESDSKQLIGLAAGGGVEAEVSRTITLRLEALTYQFEAENFTVGGTEIEADNSQTVVRAGLGVKLN